MSNDNSVEISNVSEAIQVNEVLKSQTEQPLSKSASLAKPKQNLTINKPVRAKHNPKKISSRPPLSQRSNCFRKESDERLKTQREKCEAEEMKECTFAPKVNKNPRNKRDFNEYYKDAMKFQSKKQRRIEQEKERKIKEEKKQVFSFKPQICPRSAKITRQKPKLPRTSSFRNDLSCTSKMMKSETSNNTSRNSSSKVLGIPKITKTAKDLKRRGRAHEILYSDAIRRHSAKNSPEPPRKISLSPRSEGLVKSGFLREFNYIASLIDEDKCGFLNYKRYKQFFKSMGFLRKAKSYSEDLILIIDLWESLPRTNERVNVRDLMVAMMGVMGYYKAWMSDRSLQSFVLNEVECTGFHEQYIRLFHNRFGEKRIKVSKIYAKLLAPEHSFQSGDKEKQSTVINNSRRNSRSSFVIPKDSSYHKSQSITGRKGTLLGNIQTLRRSTLDSQLIKDKKSIIARNPFPIADLKHLDITEMDSWSSSSQSNSFSPQKND